MSRFHFPFPTPCFQDFPLDLYREVSKRAYLNWKLDGRRPPQSPHLRDSCKVVLGRRLHPLEPQYRLISYKTPRFNTLIPKGLRAVVPTMCPSHYGGFEHG